MSDKAHVAGLSFGGGKKDNFYFSVLEYFKTQDRWFLAKLHQVKEEDHEGNQSIINWIDDYKLKNLTVDFPHSNPHCEGCKLECPGADICIDEDVIKSRKIIQNTLEVDTEIYKNDPKAYERFREIEKQIDCTEKFAKQPTNGVLLKTVKNKLKKGYSPYWNRPIDVWITLNYHSFLMKYFKVSFDSFSRSSMMLKYRFNYLKKHLPSDLNFYESNAYIILLEFYRFNVISKKDLVEYTIYNSKIQSKKNIIKSIEKKLNVFIYDKDLDSLIKNPKAFESFLLSIVSQRLYLNDYYKLPEWSLRDNENFLIPKFN
jgi:hypothetical protein